MPESVNIKLKLDAADIQALAGGGRGVGVGGTAIGVAGGMALFGAMKSGIDKLVASSVQLQGSLMILTKSFELFLRPIADTIGLWIRPMAIKLLQVSRKWLEFSQKSPQAATAIAATLGIGGVSLVAGMTVAKIATALGLTGATVATAAAGGSAGIVAGSIVLPATLVIAGAILTALGIAEYKKEIEKSGFKEATQTLITSVFTKGIGKAFSPLAEIFGSLGKLGVEDSFIGKSLKFIMDALGIKIPEGGKKTAESLDQIAESGSKAVTWWGYVKEFFESWIPPEKELIVNIKVNDPGGVFQASGAAPKAGQPGARRFEYIQSNLRAGETSAQGSARYRSEVAAGAYDLNRKGQVVGA